MQTQRTLSALLVAAVGAVSALGLAACDLDVPDLNNPALSELEERPDAVKIGAACTGLLIGNRSNKAAPNGYVSQLGILGRESYNFDTSDPRYVGELLGGTLSQGSPFGGNFWALPYANIRLGNVILRALDKVAAGELSDPEKSAIRGFVHTTQALDLLEVIATHDTNGAVIDTDQPIVEPPAVQPVGKIVAREDVYTKIASLLDAAQGELAAGSAEFPFALSSGYKGFAAPATYLKFNRAIRARVAAYVQDYPTALTALGASFIDETTVPDLNLGVYHSYSTKTGDVANGLINPNIYAHPALEADAKVTGPTDARYTRKVAVADEPGSVNKTPLKSTINFAPLYGSPASPVAVIRNEELLLLKVEALYFTGGKTAALNLLNKVRTVSGALADRAAPATDAAFVTDLLYERRYSLLFEGHRWIDVRRFGRTAELPLDDPSYKRNIRYPIPRPECNARPDEPRCDLGSL